MVRPSAEQHSSVSDYPECHTKPWEHKPEHSAQPILEATHTQTDNLGGKRQQLSIHTLVGE